MKDETYEKLKMEIINYLMKDEVDETVEDKINVLTDMIIFINDYRNRNKGYQIRLEKEKQSKMELCDG